jgi:tetratricopeptide (TPR) repeat protein
MVGVILSLRTWRTRIGELALFVGYAASVVLFFVLGRYRIVALPLFAAFAGVGIAGMVSFIKEREFLWLTIAIAAVAAAFGIAKRGDFSEKYAFPYFNISHALVQGGRYEEAEKLLPLGLEIDPWSPLGLELKGLLALERGDLEDADEALTASLEIPPTRTSALLALARVREKQGQIAEAAGLLEGILEVDPFNESARRQLKALRNFGGRR